MTVRRVRSRAGRQRGLVHLDRLTCCQLALEDAAHFSVVENLHGQLVKGIVGRRQGIAGFGKSVERDRCRQKAGEQKTHFASCDRHMRSLVSEMVKSARLHIGGVLAGNIVHRVDFAILDENGERTETVARRPVRGFSWTSAQAVQTGKRNFSRERSKLRHCFCRPVLRGGSCALGVAILLRLHGAAVRLDASRSHLGKCVQQVAGRAVLWLSQGWIVDRFGPRRIMMAAS